MLHLPIGPDTQIFFLYGTADEQPRTKWNSTPGSGAAANDLHRITQPRTGNISVSRSWTAVCTLADNMQADIDLTTGKRNHSAKFQVKNNK